MLLRSNMDLSELSESFIKMQDEMLDRVRKFIIEKNFPIELDDDNFYLDSTTEMRFHCLICNKDFYLPYMILKSSHVTECKNHKFNCYITPKETDERKKERREYLERTDNKEEKNILNERKKLKNKKFDSHLAIQLKKYFKKNYNSISEYEVCINPDTGKFLPYDIYIDLNNKKYFIEIQGGQHYEFSPDFHNTQFDFKYQQYKDKIKKNYADHNGILIEIDARNNMDAIDAIEIIERIIGRR